MKTKAISQPKIIHPRTQTKHQSTSSKVSEESIQSLDVIILNAGRSNLIIKPYEPMRTPRSELKTEPSLVHSVSSFSIEIDQKFDFDVYPKIFELPYDDMIITFCKKCKQCEQIVQFTNKEHQEYIEQKSQILSDILSAVSNQQFVSKLTLSEYQQILNFCSKNIFRAPTRMPPTWFRIDQPDFAPDKIEESSWPHISIVYMILKAFFSNPKFNPNLCQKETYSMCIRLPSLFRSPDERERRSVSDFLTIFYKTFPHLRNELQKSIIHFLSDNPSIGVRELLNSLRLLATEMKIFSNPEICLSFFRTLLFLHESPYLFLFQPDLLQVLKLIIIQQPNFCLPLFQSLLRYWPQASQVKVECFLFEMDFFWDDFGKLNYSIQKTLFVKIIEKISCCFYSSSVAIAEKSLFLFQKASFLRLITNYSINIFPIILPALFKSYMTHWRPEIRNLAVSIMSILKNSDESHFTAFSDLKKIEIDRISQDIKRANSWAHFAECLSDPNEKAAIRAQISSVFDGCDTFIQTSSSLIPGSTIPVVNKNNQFNTSSNQSSLLLTNNPINGNKTRIIGSGSRLSSRDDYAKHSARSMPSGISRIKGMSKTIKVSALRPPQY